MRPLRILALFVCTALAGCRSPYVEATVANRTAQPIDLVEVDYPSASFGTQQLAPGANFHYRFKVIGSGNVTLTYTVAHHDNKSQGPVVSDGDSGALLIAITPNGVDWHRTPAAKNP